MPGFCFPYRPELLSHAERDLKTVIVAPLSAGGLRAERVKVSGDRIASYLTPAPLQTSHEYMGMERGEDEVIRVQQIPPLCEAERRG